MQDGRGSSSSSSSRRRLLICNCLLGDSDQMTGHERWRATAWACAESHSQPASRPASRPAGWLGPALWLRPGLAEPKSTASWPRVGDGGGGALSMDLTDKQPSPPLLVAVAVAAARRVCHLFLLRQRRRCCYAAGKLAERSAADRGGDDEGSIHPQMGCRRPERERRWRGLRRHGFVLRQKAAAAIRSLGQPPWSAAKSQKQQQRQRRQQQQQQRQQQQQQQQRQGRVGASEAGTEKNNEILFSHFPTMQQVHRQRATVSSPPPPPPLPARESVWAPKMGAAQACQPT